jgi:hypothetical protein
MKMSLIVFQFVYLVRKATIWVKKLKICSPESSSKIKSIIRVKRTILSSLFLSSLNKVNYLQRKLVDLIM